MDNDRSSSDTVGMSQQASVPTLIFAAVYTLVVTILAWVAFAIMSEGSKARITGHKLKWRETIKMGAQFGLFVDMVLILIIGVIFGAAPATRWLARTSSGNHALLTGGAISAAIVLFALRKRHRIFYGMIEVAASIGGMIVYPVAPAPAAEGLSTQTVAWVLGLLSLVYILVRGLDNIDVGRANRRREASG